MTDGLVRLPAAGFVDSIVGGLTLVPPLFGVNKGAPVWGPAAATAQYVRRMALRWLGYDFLNASAKRFNTATNLAALALFAWKGHVWWHFALTMAVAKVVGSLLGARLALRHGAGFVRGVFIVVVSAQILKAAFDAFLK